MWVQSRMGQDGMGWKCSDHQTASRTGSHAVVTGWVQSGTVRKCSDHRIASRTGLHAVAMGWNGLGLTRHCFFTSTVRHATFRAAVIFLEQYASLHDCCNDNET